MRGTFADKEKRKEKKKAKSLEQSANAANKKIIQVSSLCILRKKGEKIFKQCVHFFVNVMFYLFFRTKYFGT